MDKSKTPQKLPYKQFLESFKYAPRPAVNLLVVRDDGAILLTKRRKPPFPGSWHMPGSWLIKHEKLTDCIRRVAKEELGVKVDNISLAGVYEDIFDDPRGHAIDIVYRCRLATKGLTFKGLTFSGKVRPLQTPKPVGDTAQVKFFKKLPRNIGFNHSDTLNRLGYS